MSKNIRGEVDQLMANEVTRKNYVSLYRCIKTISMLKNMFISEALSLSVYQDEVRVMQEIFKKLRDNIAEDDMMRFCELWGIQAEFANIGKDLHVSEIKVSQGIYKITNLYIRLNDQILMEGAALSSYYEALSNFCQLLKRIRTTDKSLTSTIMPIIDRILQAYNEMSTLYSQSREPDLPSVDQLKDSLSRFKVQLQKIAPF